jgi:hypothetical protein
MEPTKRELRRQKRELKQAGSQHRRRALKQELRDNPDAAHQSEENFGRYSTERLNGIDRDSTRKRS